MQRHYLIVLGGLVVVALAGFGGWTLQREAACTDRLEQAALFGDAEVRRDKTGRCYLCRPDGPLFDIALDHCNANDRPYSSAKQSN